MARSGKGTNPFQVPRSGKIVAFTVSLGKPDAMQVRSFNSTYGGPPQVRISVLRRGDKRKTRLNHRLLRQSPWLLADRGCAPALSSSWRYRSESRAMSWANQLPIQSR